MKSLPQLALLFLLFTSMAFVSGVLRAQDIHGYEIDRYEYFTQCTSNRAPLATARLHTLAAYVFGNYDGAVISGSLAHSKVSWPLTNNGSRVEAHVPLDTTAGAGSYTFTVTTAAQGVQRRTVSMPAPATRIAPARITNLTGCQAVEATQPFTVQWDPVQGTGQRDFLRFRVIDSEGQLLVDEQLSKDQTSFIIPGGTLAPSTTNTAYLGIAHLASLVPSRNGGPYFIGAEYRITRFFVQTLHPEGQIIFPENQLFAHEADGVISIPVQRTGSAGTVTVDYFTENVTAQAALNYVPTNGTLTFSPGITNLVITVPLLDDGQAGGPLIARLRLTNAASGVLLPSWPWLDWSILDTQTAPGQNVTAVVISKIAFSFQENDDPSDQSARCVTSRFFASVHPRFPGALSNAIVRLPRRSTRLLNEPYGSFLEHNEDFPTRALMDRQFPAGPYTVEVNTLTQGHLTESLRMMTEPRFPTPHLTNWTAAQTIDSAAPFALRWEAFQGATSNDFIGVSVRDEAGIQVLETPESFEPGALPGATTSHEISANTLRPDERYLVSLVFGKTARCTTNAASGVKNCVVFGHTTAFYVHTAPLVIPSPERATDTRFKGGSDCCNPDALPGIPEGPFLEAITGRK